MNTERVSSPRQYVVTGEKDQEEINRLKSIMSDLEVSASNSKGER